MFAILALLASLAVVLGVSRTTDPRTSLAGPLSADDPAAARAAHLVRTTQPPTSGSARCSAPAADPVLDGAPMVVSIPPAPAFTVGAIPATTWRNPPSADASWRLNFEGLMWLRPLAQRAAQDNQPRSLAAIVDQAVAFHRQNRDTGTSRYGWDEGTALRRLETENCLYTLTRAAALVPGMEADARVLLGDRYYGPPRFSVHNHGLMANLQLLRAGALLDRPQWTKTAIRRMTREAPLAFSPAGTSWEQSSMYQQVNANLWDSAARALDEAGESAAAAEIRATVARAHAVFAWMTEPDGHIVQVGDSDRVAGAPALSTSHRVLRDDPAGWVVGRWSWSDPGTTYYTVRYGPPLRGHGHHDRAGGVTWSTSGVRVLVGPGRYSYDAASNYRAYQASPRAQNVAVPDGRTAGTGASSVAASAVRGSAHSWTVRDTVYGIGHTRRVEVDHDSRRMRVSDSFPGAPRCKQYWHLDPAWTLVSGGPGDRRLVFAHPGGHRLTVTTTGRTASIDYGRTRPPAGWNFPAFQQREPAAEIAVRSTGGPVTTTFVMS
ncbi:MAG TPA: hypothetical protein VFT95_12370 [Micromonosporaceae bacterium]|nr:hypothetical protein [Micromonosporaceae bacterium]